MNHKLKSFINKIDRRVPYIPDFSNIWTILRVFIVSMFLSTIYTFSQLDKASEFYLKVIPSTKIFLPYLVLQLLLIIFLSKIINKVKPIFGFLIIIVTNIVSVYFVYANTHNDYSIMFNSFEDGLSQLAVSLSILFFFLLYFDWKEKNVNPENNKAKLMYLQSKMRPHFLFNTMNTVVSLIKSNPEVAKKMLLNLSELLRVSIKEEDITFMYSLKEEKNLCEKYLEIEKIRLRERLNIVWDVEEDILNAKVPKLFLQPIIENAVLHGIQNIGEGGTINIKIVKNNGNRIFIEIENPILMDSDKDTTSNNISIKNIKERLEIYYEKDISYINKIIEDKYCVLIDIPYLFN